MIRPAARTAFLFCIAVACCATPLRAAEAPAQPAMKSAKAAKSLLTDVVRAGTRLVAVGERGHIVWSDDDGKSWQQADVPTRVLLTAVYFPEPGNGWATGHDSTILHSGDGGRTWQLQHRAQYQPAAAGDDAAMDDAALDEEAWEDEGGDDARGDAAEARKGAPLLDVWFADAQNGIAVGAYGLMLATRDGGKTWEDRSSSLSNGDGWHLNAIAGVPGAPGAVLIAGERGTIYRSLDGGRSFQALASPFEGSWFGLVGIARDEVLLFGLQGRLYSSADLGGSWRAIDSGVTSGLNDGALLDDGTRLIAGNGGVVLSSREGATFATLRRSDRQTVMSAAAVPGGAVLVGEGGAKLARADGNNLQ